VNDTNKHFQHGKHRCARPSSFWMQEPTSVFSELGLEAGDVFVDLGCGMGEYALYAARLVGTSGLVYALDKSESLILGLEQRASAAGIANITAMVADATEPLPIKDNCANVCLVATVLHIPDVVKNVKMLCTEIRRVLRADGRLGIIECHKHDLSFGPPEYMRLSPNEVKDLLAQHNFKALSQAELGYNYLIQFALT